VTAIRDDRELIHAEAAAEVHPAMCTGGDPLGCGGFHLAQHTTVHGRDKEGVLPIHVAATVDDRTGERLVDLLFEFVWRGVSVTFTGDGAREFAAALVRHADLLDAPAEPRWSWPIDRIRAYGKALLTWPTGGAA
jgi:hypothetical protein